MGDSFEIDLYLFQVLTADFGWTGTVGIGLNSAFALSNPIFSISPKSDHFALTIAPSHFCEFVYLPVSPVNSWWRLDAVSISIGSDSSLSVPAQIVTGTFGLDSTSWVKFWDLIYQIVPHTSWIFDPRGLRYTTDLCVIDVFPSFTITLGQYVHTIEPIDYILMGSLAADAENGCTVRITESGSQVSVGTAFFEKNIVLFDNQNMRLGFCPID